jgi:hypothetical protein
VSRKKGHNRFCHSRPCGLPYAELRRDLQNRIMSNFPLRFGPPQAVGESAASRSLRGGRSRVSVLSIPRLSFRLRTGFRCFAKPLNPPAPGAPEIHKRASDAIVRQPPKGHPLPHPPLSLRAPPVGRHHLRAVALRHFSRSTVLPVGGRAAL